MTSMDSKTARSGLFSFSGLCTNCTGTARDLAPSQATTGIKITLTSFVSVCWTSLVRVTLSAVKFSELPLGSTIGARS